ncbi:hypothetical protein Bbelb_140610 [Branchiostoma belcheri]|nr:hypothetical protein Bbelb_140610 [Branchiostoma belcheri]
MKHRAVSVRVGRAVTTKPPRETQEWCLDTRIVIVGNITVLLPATGREEGCSALRGHFLLPAAREVAGKGTSYNGNRSQDDWSTFDVTIRTQTHKNTDFYYVTSCFKY